MKIIQCEKNHYYDFEKYADCPYCMAKKMEKPEQMRDAENSTVLLEQTVILEERTVCLESDRTVVLPDNSSSGRESIKNRRAPTAEEIFINKETRCFSEEDEKEYRKVSESHCLNCMEEYDARNISICPNCGFLQGTPPEAAFHLHPGAGLNGRYVIGTVLGFGGFGITYRAWDIKLQSIVAIKEYYPAGVVNRMPGEKEVILFTGKSGEEFQKGLKRFLEEAQNTVRFNAHPNIVHVFDYFEENGTAYMVMELLRGCNLEEYIHKCGGKVPWQEAVSIFNFVVDALNEMHSQKMIHRDLSPDNIFICQDGTVKLMDLGAARRSNLDAASEMTIILKRGMAPPEQYAKNGKQGTWTDVYALAATLYWTVTGVDPEESTDRVREDLLKPPREINPEIPLYLENTILKGMALLVDLRFKDMEEFGKALRNERQVEVLYKEIAKRKKRRILGIFSVAVIIICAFCVGLNSYSSRKTQAQLTDTVITAWVPVEINEKESDRQAIWEEMTQAFKSDYPHVRIEATFIPRGEYEYRLLDALNKGSQEPTLFESTDIINMEDKFADASEAIELLDKNNYYFIDQYQDFFPGGKQIPLGFDLTVLYTNSLMLQKNAALLNINSLNKFLEEKSPACIAGISSFYQVQDALPGIYTLHPLAAESHGSFNYLWSVNQISEEAQKLAAVRLLYYGLSENAQDVIHISHRGSLPLSKSQMDIYLEVNQELVFIKEQLGELKFINPKDLGLEKNRQYETLFKENKLSFYFEENTKE